MTAWVESSCPSDCEKIWEGGVDVCYYHRIQHPPKQSHNHLGSHSRPRPSLIFKVGYWILDSNQNFNLSKYGPVTSVKCEQRVQAWFSFCFSLAEKVAQILPTNQTKSNSDYFLHAVETALIGLPYNKCAILLTCNLFSFNADVNWLPGFTSPYGYSR